LARSVEWRIAFPTIVGSAVSDPVDNNLEVLVGDVWTARLRHAIEAVGWPAKDRYKKGILGIAWPNRNFAMDGAIYEFVS
jgi:hypothetical protein